jgi:uncharacterized protein YdeI (YjbR/CyaY-like superfamily)
MDPNPYISAAERGGLTRAIHPMPAYIDEALQARNLVEAYRARPAYQKNDYVGWITRGKREETRQKRLAQMLEELAGGDKYMKMDYGG